MGQSCGKQRDADYWPTGGDVVVNALDSLKSLHPQQPSGSADLAHSWLKVALLLADTDRVLLLAKQKEPTLRWTYALTKVKT